MSQSFQANESDRTRTDELAEQIVAINRTAKVVKGGRRFHFAAVVVVGDRSGRVGVGTGKANEVPDAIRKAGDRARRTMISVPLIHGTIPHEVAGHFGPTTVILKPASEGTGVIAGSAVRLLLDAAGIHNVLSKILGSRNPHNVTKAALAGLQQLRTIQEHYARRGKLFTRKKAAEAGPLA